MNQSIQSTHRSVPDDGFAGGLRRGILIGLAVLVIAIPPDNRRSEVMDRDGIPVDSASASSVEVGVTSATPGRPRRQADFRSDTASPDARRLVDWVAATGDNAGIDFLVVDKKAAKVYVFDADAQLRGSTPVLLGAARGDDSVPGIGTRPIPDILPEERTTPAGRFLGQLGQNAGGEDVVWVDYDAAISMHRVRTTNKKEHRLERLASPSIDDNRISYGCINMPVAFYEGFVQSTFARQRAPIYVLPDQKSLQQVFGAYDAAAAVQRETGTATLLGTAPAPTAASKSAPS